MSERVKGYYVIPGDEPDYDEDDGNFAGNFYDVTAVPSSASPFISVAVGCEYDRAQESGYFDAATARRFAADILAAADEVERMASTPRASRGEPPVARTDQP